MEEDKEINVHTNKRKKVILLTVLLGVIAYFAWILIEGLYIIPNTDYGILELNEVEKFNLKFISNVRL